MSQQTKPQPLTEDRAETVSFTLRDLLLYFLRLGTFGFGGPIALAGYMQRDLVEERHWVSKSDYLEGLAFSQLSPGPLAAQLAMYIGWLRARFIGATLVGIAFILPSFLMVAAIGRAYVELGGTRVIAGLFYGIGAAVIAMIPNGIQLHPGLPISVVQEITGAVLLIAASVDAISRRRSTAS